MKNDALRKSSRIMHARADCQDQAKTGAEIKPLSRGPGEAGRVTFLASEGCRETFPLGNQVRD